MIAFRSKEPAIQTLHSLELPPYDYQVLPNGIELYAIEPAATEVVKLGFLWRGGSGYDQRNYLSRAALGLSLNGSTRLSASEILEQFEFWGTMVNPGPGIFFSEFDLKSTREYFLPSLKWFAEHYENAAYPDAELNTWKQTHAADLHRRMATPKYWAYRECMQLVFGADTPVSRFTNPEEILTLDRDEIKQTRSSRYPLSSSAVYLSGDYSNDILKQVIAELTSLRTVPNPSPAAFPGSDWVSHIHEKNHPVPNTSQVSMFMCRPVPEIDEMAYHQFSLLNLILGGFFGSRLMQTIREEKGLTYGIGSYFTQTHNGNAWCISGEMNSANAGLALDETREILRSMFQAPPTGDELEKAKRYYTGQLRAGFDGPFAMAGKLKFLWQRGYSIHHLESAMDAIWSCTTEDLYQIADNYLRPEAFKTVLAGDIQ